MYTVKQAKAKMLKELEGKKVFIEDKEGKIRVAKVRIKKVRCGKPNCKKCPHAIYAYAQYREGKKVTEKYLGVAG